MISKKKRLRKRSHRIIKMKNRIKIMKKRNGDGVEVCFDHI